MKKITFLAMLFAVALNVFAQSHKEEGYYMQVWNDGFSTNYFVTYIDSITFTLYTPDGDGNGDNTGGGSGDNTGGSGDNGGNNNNPPTVSSFYLSSAFLKMKVGDTHQLTAEKAVETWKSSNLEVATVDANGLVTATGYGTAMITATAVGGGTAMCGVSVDFVPKTTKGIKNWPVVLDTLTYFTNKTKMVADFRADDTNNHLQIWENGYTGGDNTDLNFNENTLGYVALNVTAPKGWSGLGFLLNNSYEAVTALRDSIVANPTKYYLHLAIKSETEGSHQFFIFDDKINTSFIVGNDFVDTERGIGIVGDFERDGEWEEFDIPLAQFAEALSKLTISSTNGINIFCALSGNTPGLELNLDAVYFYEVE